MNLRHGYLEEMCIRDRYRLLKNIYLKTLAKNSNVNLAQTLTIDNNYRTFFSLVYQGLVALGKYNHL